MIDTSLQDLGNCSCDKETQTLRYSKGDLYPKSSFSSNPKPFESQNNNTLSVRDPFGLNQPNFGTSQIKNPFESNPSSSFEQNTSSIFKKSMF